ncbi:MAG: hypothetical protein ACK5RK_00055 [Betaproteobacteria bacterium]
MQNQSGPQIPFAAIAVVMAFVSSVWYTQRTIEPTRPPEPDRYRYDFDIGREVDARLWEDPFAAAFRGLEAMSKRAGAGAAPLPAIGQLLGPDGAAPAAAPHAEKVLAVLLPGNPFVGAEEQRRRLRYAVLAGLRSEGWTPRTPEYLGVAQAAAEGDSSTTLKVPFEFLISSADGGARQVLLLWVDEAQLPSRRFDRLAHLLGQMATSAGLGTEQPVRLAVVGPSSSSALRSALSDLRQSRVSCTGGSNDAQPACDGYRWLATAVFINAAASVPIDRLGLPPDDLPPAAPFMADTRLAARADELRLQAALRRYLGRVLDDATTVAASYRSTVTNDAAVARAIVAEMRARGVGRSEAWQLGAGDAAPGAGAAAQARVIVVAESDSFYAQQLYEELAEASREAMPDVQDVKLRPERYSYFRGADGVADKPLAAAGAGARAASGAVEWPEGTEQRDYLRRLAGQLRRSERGAAGPISAFVLIGSDVHDKLLVMQALRETFPDKPFFTSDFDVRLLHPRVRDFTRNLVVVSEYGTQVDPVRDQGKDSAIAADVANTLPFRSSAQMAMYRAARIAAQPAGAAQAEHVGPRPCLRLWEMSRNGLVPMAVPWEQLPVASRPLPQTQCTAAGRAAPRGASVLVLLPVALALAALLLWPSTPGLRRVRDHLASSWRNARRVAPLRHRRTWGADAQGFVLALFLGLHTAAAAWFVATGVEAFAPGSVTVARALAVALLGMAAAWLLLYPGAPALARALRRHSRPPQTALGLTALIALATGTGLAFAVLGWTTVPDTTREPLRWLQGVSGWPAQLLTVAAIMLAIAVLDAAWCGIERSNIALARELFGAHLPPCRHGLLAAAPATSTVSLWRAALSPRWPRPQGGSLSFMRVWLRYQAAGLPAARVLRLVVLAAASAALLLAVFVPRAEGYRLELPVRGTDHRALMGWTQLAAALAFLLLATAVCEATLVCCFFVNALDRGRTAYPAKVARRFGAALGGLDEAAWLRRFAVAPQLRGNPEGALRHRLLDDWIDVQIVARRTSTIAALVIGPFVVLTLLMLARSRLFDGFALTPALVVLFALCLLVLIAVAMALKLVAERLRQRALERMRADLRWLRGAGEPWSALERKFEALIADVVALRSGAFAPFFDQPLVRAILVPLTGASGIQVFEYLLLAR